MLKAPKYVADSKIMNKFHVISYHNCFKGTTRWRKSIPKMGTRPYVLFFSRTSEKKTIIDSIGTMKTRIKCPSAQIYFWLISYCCFICLKEI